jgi:gamma-glutamylcyclotransferase (GGCT)/AIG2-like uncharacterized protein YtfP
MVHDDYLPLFAYGSLRRGDRAAGLVDSHITRRESAVARGRKVDTGAWYPGVAFGSGGEIRGELLWIDRNTYAEVLERIDDFEGVPSRFRRVRISVVAERGPVEAYAYEWVAAVQD